MFVCFWYRSSSHDTPVPVLGFRCPLSLVRAFILTSTMDSAPASCCVQISIYASVPVLWKQYFCSSGLYNNYTTLARLNNMSKHTLLLCCTTNLVGSNPPWPLTTSCTATATQPLYWDWGLRMAFSTCRKCHASHACVMLRLPVYTYCRQVSSAL